MLKNFVKNSFWIAIALCCATQMAYAQADPTVQHPFPAGSGLIGALTAHGLDAMGAGEKKEMQKAIGNGHVAAEVAGPDVLVRRIDDLTKPR